MQRRERTHHGEEGSILLLVAFASIALLGVGALTLDVGHAYDVRNQLSMSADAAAKAGAYEIYRANPVATAYQAFANRVVAEDRAAGRIPASTTVAAVRLCSDVGATCAAGYSSNKYVEVILENTGSTFLGGLVGLSSMTPRARAVAGFSTSTACLISLDPSGGVTMSVPAGNLDASGCTIAVAGEYNARATVVSNGGTAGDCKAGCTGFSWPAPAPTDPFSTLPVPTAAECGNGLPGTQVDVDSSKTITPGTYTDIDFPGKNKVLTLSPGIYCITGTIGAKNSGRDTMITGNGVLVYISPSGQFDTASNDSVINLGAMTTGPFAGIAIYQDRTNDKTMSLAKNNGDINLDGAIYAPRAEVKMKNTNNGSANLCGLMVVGSLTWDKPENAKLANACGSFSGSPIKTIAMAE